MEARDMLSTLKLKDTKPMRLSLADWKCSPKEREYVNQVLDSGWLTYGPFQKKLEAMWSSYHNCRYGVINSSGTSALQLAFRALKETDHWTKESEVICPAITFPATINMVTESGLRPRLCDVSIKDGMIDCKSLERQINDNTKAVCIVHLWGNPYPRRNELFELCKKYDLRIVEDSCETISHDVGNWGDVSCFSMYFNHIISAGVGGMACTNDKKIAEIMRSLANHGMVDTEVKPKYKRFVFERVGYSSRVTEMEAALGVAQFERIDEILAYRMQLRDIITIALSDVKQVTAIGGVMMYPLLVDEGIYINQLMADLDRMGVETRTALPITPFKPFERLAGDLSVCGEFNRRGIFLPIHPYMKKEHCLYAVECLKKAIISQGRY